MPKTLCEADCIYKRPLGYEDKKPTNEKNPWATPCPIKQEKGKETQFNRQKESKGNEGIEQKQIVDTMFHAPY